MSAGTLLLAGCAGPPGGGSYNRDLPPTLDRLVAAYEDLASKRFEIVADFEAPEQGTLFHVEPPGSAGLARISAERARSETGVGSLKMTFVDSRQRVVAVDGPDAKWSLVRDWSKYQLLVMSVFSPRKLGGFLVTVRSGTAAPLSCTIPRIVLNPGWNLVRLDLGDLLEQVNLSDVRAVEFGCDPLESPVDLYLDDVVLADNSRQVYGLAEGPTGELYARTEGRRLAVGARGRFEVVFSRGLIRQWYDLGQDAARLHNLVGRGALGPIPVVVPAEGSGAGLVLEDATAWAGLGVAAAVHQTLVEATPLYARVEGQVRFGGVDTPPDDASPAHRWVYTICRDGRMYVECAGTARSDNFNPGSIGMAFTCDAASGFRRMIAQSQPADTQPAVPGSATFALFPRTERNAADLLVIPSAPLPARSIENTLASRAGVLWTLPDVGATFAFAALVKLWPTDIDSAAVADPIALDYQNPLPIGLEAGQLGRTDPGDLNTDGFSEARGVYAVQLDGTVAKIRIQGQSRLRFSPIFRIMDVASRDVWAYLDGRQIRDVQRDADGNAIFCVPEVLSHDALLEITSRQRERIKGLPAPLK